MIKTVHFKPLPIEIEVKDLKFVKELPKLLGQPHKATFYQLIWLTEGEAVFRIDFREIPVKANEMLLIATGQVCQFDTVSAYSGKLILFTGSFFTVTELDANFLYTSEIFHPVNLNKTIPISKEVITHLISLLSNKLKEPGDTFRIHIAQSYLRIILFEAERTFSPTPCPAHSLGRNFFNAVETHFRENHSTVFYVNLLRVNEKSLSKETKALTGKTPKAYIDSRIILEAKRLLAYSALSAKEIGFELGFDEPTNFTKYFHKHTGVTPISFRKDASL